MAQRIFSELRGNVFLRNDEVVTYTINVTPSLIEFRCDVAYDDTVEEFDSATGEVTSITKQFNEPISVWKLPITAIKSLPRLKSNVLLGVINPPMKFDKEFLTAAQILNVSELAAQQRTSLSCSTKLFSQGNPPVLQIFIRDVDGDFDSHDIILYGEPNTIINSNEPFTAHGGVLKHIELVDNITCSKDETYESAEYVKYNVSTESHVDEVFLEPVVGIPDRLRCSIDSTGKGSFRVLKSSVLAGENVRVKLGFSTYPGISEVNGTI